MTEALIAEQLQDVEGRKILLDVSASPLRPFEWAQQFREQVDAVLNDHGALLLRGFRLHSTKQFGQFLEGLFGENLAEYRYRSTPRTKLGGNVYTATEYHPSETIQQHNESSYANAWAMRIGFYCMVPPAPGAGGATPLADSRAVLRRLPPDLVEKFEARKLQYVRNYGSIDLPWTEVFQTDDREQVETFCRQNGLTYEWGEEGGLRTRQVTPALAVHPVTGDAVWFNQAHLFHISGLADEIAQDMLAVYKEEDVPRNCYFGDGSLLDVSDLDVIRRAYVEERFHFDWQKNDILLLDNMLFTHGRQPYVGERKILVGMAGHHSHPVSA